MPSETVIQELLADWVAGDKTAYDALWVYGETKFFARMRPKEMEFQEMGKSALEVMQEVYLIVRKTDKKEPPKDLDDFVKYLQHRARLRTIDLWRQYYKEKKHFVHVPGIEDEKETLLPATDTDKGAMSLPNKQANELMVRARAFEQLDAIPVADIPQWTQTMETLWERGDSCMMEWSVALVARQLHCPQLRLFQDNQARGFLRKVLTRHGELWRLLQKNAENLGGANESLIMQLVVEQIIASSPMDQSRENLERTLLDLARDGRFLSVGYQTFHFTCQVAETKIKTHRATRDKVPDKMQDTLEANTGLLRRFLESREAMLDFDKVCRLLAGVNKQRAKCFRQFFLFRRNKAEIARHWGWDPKTVTSMLNASMGFISWHICRLSIETIKDQVEKAEAEKDGGEKDQTGKDQGQKSGG